MDRHSVNWRGNFCAAITPFAEDGALDEDRFARNLQLLVDEGIDGFVIAGHTGEAWALDVTERFRIFDIAVAVVSGRVPSHRGGFGHSYR